MGGPSPFAYRIVAATLVVLLVPLRGAAQQATDSTEVVAAVTAFHQARREGGLPPP
jgi:hypothetical protein